MLRSARVAPIALVLLLASAFAGCIEPPLVAAREVFVLDFEINDHGREEKTAEPGHHCGDAGRSGDTLTISLWPDEEPPEGPWLAVFPRMPEDWHSGLGDASYKTTFPARVQHGIYDAPGDLGTLTWEPREEGGVIRLDGRAVALPHTWRVTGEDGTWSVDATLSAWDGKVELERYDGFCD